MRNDAEIYPYVSDLRVAPSTWAEFRQEGSRIPTYRVKSIQMSEDQELIIKDLDEYATGIQYYDLQGIDYINNTGLAHLIDFVKHQLAKGLELRFINSSNMIRNKISSMHLEHIIPYE